MTRGDPIQRLVRTLVGILLVSAAFPLLWVIRVALKPTEEYVLDPSGIAGTWTLENFSLAWSTAGLSSAIVNSAVVVMIGASLAVAIGAMAGYALANFDFPGRLLVLSATTVVLFLPIAGLVIPIFDVALTLGVLGLPPALGVVYGGIFAAWTTLFLMSFFRGLPRETLEAAYVDGAGRWRAFIAVAVPMARPALATAFVLNIFVQWSELILGLILLPQNESQTVAAAVARLSTQYRGAGPLNAAGLIIGATPVLLVFLLGQRWLRAGSLAGGMKG